MQLSSGKELGSVKVGAEFYNPLHIKHDSRRCRTVCLLLIGIRYYYLILVNCAAHTDKVDERLRRFRWALLHAQRVTGIHLSELLCPWDYLT